MIFANRTLEQSNSFRLEKSTNMEDKYKDSPDPWGNVERDLYGSIISRLVKTMIENNIEFHDWYDIGCGGGNVGRSFRRAFDESSKEVFMRGCDVSPSAIRYLEEDETSPYNELTCVDLETITLEEAKELFAHTDSVSIIDVLYYFGAKRSWKTSLDIIWDALPSGSVVVVADCLVRHQYRDYLKSKEDSELLIEYTDYDTVMCTETSANGTVWKRYLKLRVYRKN